MFEAWIEAVCRSLLTRCQTEDAKWLSRTHTHTRVCSFLIGWRRCASEPTCTPWRFSLAKLNVYARAANWGIEYSYGSNPLSRKGEFNYAWLPGSNPTPPPLALFLEHPPPPFASFHPLSPLHRLYPPSPPRIIRVPTFVGRLCLREQLGQFYAYWYVNTVPPGGAWSGFCDGRKPFPFPSRASIRLSRAINVPARIEKRILDLYDLSRVCLKE